MGNLQLLYLFDFENKFNVFHFNSNFKKHIHFKTNRKPPPIRAQHGFSFGYYLTFATEFLSLLCLQHVQRRHRALGLDSNRLYAALVLFPATHLIAAHGYVPFETLTYAKTVPMLSAVGWPVHAAMLAYLAAETALAALRPKSAKKQQ